MAQDGYGCNESAPFNDKLIGSSFEKCSGCPIAAEIPSDTEVQSALGDAIGSVRFKMAEIVEHSSGLSAGSLGK